MVFQWLFESEIVVLVACAQVLDLSVALIIVKVTTGTGKTKQSISGRARRGRAQITSGSVRIYISTRTCKHGPPTWTTFYTHDLQGQKPDW